MNPQATPRKTIKRLHMRKDYNLPIYSLLPMVLHMNLLASLARFIVLVVPIFVHMFAIASVGPLNNIYWKKVPYPLH